jgi:hypothetical protein
MRSLDFADGFSSATAPTGSSGVTDHTELTSIGTNTHAQIDSHIASTSNPHGVDKADVGLSNVVNADTTTTANITDSSNKRFVTDAEKTVIGNTSGTNTGDKTFDQLSPMTTSGDMIKGGASGTATRLPVGSDGDYLVVSGGAPTWQSNPPSTVKIAVLRDEKAASTNGGTLTANTWNVRDLNTISDPSSIVTSLTSNSFTLPAGTYKITASAPIYNTGYHKIALQNTTDSTFPIIGSAEYSYQTTTRSHLTGIITIASAKSFYLVHRTGSSNSLSSDLGLASVSLGSVEVYAIVEIEKL